MSKSRHNAIQRHLRDSEDALRARVKRSEGSLFGTLLSGILDSLDRDNAGVIKPTKANQNRVARINKIYDQWSKDVQVPMVKTMVEDLKAVRHLQQSYYSALGAGSAAEISATAKTAQSRLFASLGITERGAILQGGYLDGIINDSTLKNQISRQVSSAIVNGATITQLRTSLNNLIRTNATGTGALNRTYNTFVYDTFQQYDRSFANIVAEGLRLNAFIYEGSVIKTTRPFCKSRAGKVFTREESEDWKNISFQGKNAGYNPLADLGGHNCRHSTRWISNGEALRRRQDLKMEGGKLVKK